MEQIDFVHLAWAVLDQYREVGDGNTPIVYEDDYVRIQADPSQDIALEVTRKAFIDPALPHLRVENPVTMVAKVRDEQDIPSAEIIRHHGEHNVLIPHMLYLIEVCDPYRDFFKEMLDKYPEIDVQHGIYSISTNKRDY